MTQVGCEHATQCVKTGSRRRATHFATEADNGTSVQLQNVNVSLTIQGIRTIPRNPHTQSDERGKFGRFRATTYAKTFGRSDV